MQKIKGKMDVFYYDRHPDVSVDCEIILSDSGLEAISYIDDDRSRQTYRSDLFRGNVFEMRQADGDGKATLLYLKAKDEAFGVWSERGHHGMWKFTW